MQLMVLGQVLVPIFEYGHVHWWAPALYIVGMGLVAAHAALSRPAYVYPGMACHFVIGLTGISVLVALIVVALVLRVEPLWEPQYCIPLAGMIFNNALTGISLGVNSLITELKEGRERIELLVGMGACRWEACKGLIKTASVVANTPTLNTMTVIGVVSIPGMMTGQIIGGNSPEEAAGYQLVVMFMILAANAFSVAVVCYLAMCTLVSKDGMLHTNKITKRKKSPPFWSLSVFKSRAGGCQEVLERVCSSLWCCCRGQQADGRNAGRAARANHEGPTDEMTQQLARCN